MDVSSSVSSSSRSTGVLSDYQKQCIKRARELNMSYKDIGYILDMKPDRAKKFMSRDILNGTLPPPVKVSKRITDGRVGLAIKRIYQEDPKTPYRSVPAKLKSLLSEDMKIPSASSVQKFLLSNDLRCVKLWKKPMVSEVNMERRLQYGQQYGDMDESFWKTILWSDETTVQKLPQGKEILYRVHSSTRKENLPVNVQIHSGGFSVMFWGCFSYHGFGPLVVCDGTMNGQKYMEMLQTVVLDYMEELEDVLNEDITFMQDNAPCHKSKLVMDFLKSEGVPVMIWPAQSPDLNPIENLWAIIKQRRCSKFGVPRSKNELIEQIFEIWDNLQPNLAQNLALSGQKRCQWVRENGGRMTKY